MISVTILCKNGEKHLSKVLKAVAEFPEVIIFDNGSQDKSLEIAKSFPNVKIFQGPFQGFGKTHNFVSSLTSYDWVLSLDCDEELSASLQKEILSLFKDSLPAENTIFSIQRKNFYRGKWIKGCGWHPDFQKKIYNKKATSFSEHEVHETILDKGMSVLKLKHTMNHFSYNNISDFLKKMEFYSSLFAKEHAHKKKSSPCKAVLHALYAFFKSYILKRGFLDGWRGFLISSYNGHTAFYKYMKLFEINSEKEV